MTSRRPKLRNLHAQADELQAFLADVLAADDRRRAALEAQRGPTEVLLRERERERHLKIVR